MCYTQRRHNSVKSHEKFEKKQKMMALEMDEWSTFELRLNLKKKSWWMMERAIFCQLEVQPQFNYVFKRKNSQIQRLVPKVHVINSTVIPTKCKVYTLRFHYDLQKELKIPKMQTFHIVHFNFYSHCFFTISTNSNNSTVTFESIFEIKLNFFLSQQKHFSGIESIVSTTIM